jgi:plastocyanin
MVSMRNRAATLALVGLLAAATAVPASAGDRTDRLDANGARGTVERVKIVDFRFRPGTIEVTRGTRVRWINRGAATHTTTSDTSRWDSGNLAPGESFSRVFRRAGTFAYHCSIHTDMTGTVIVS